MTSRTASISFSTPFAKDATRLFLAVSSQSSTLLAVLERIMDWKSPMASRAAAKHNSISAATGVRWQKRLEETGSTEQNVIGRPKSAGKLGPCSDAIIAKVKAQPNITMPDLAAWLLSEHGVSADPSILSKLLCRAGFTYKKNALGGGERTR